MKVIHIPFCFRPDPMGGTEVYVEALAREQMRRGVEVAIAAPAAHTSQHVDGGLPIHRFAVSAAPGLGNLYGEGDDTARQQVMAIMDREQPCLVHLHAFSSAISAPLAQELQQRGVRLVFTYHTPTVSCARGTLLRWGNEICDGRLDVHRCSACTLHSHGLGRHPASIVGSMPGKVGRLVAGFGVSGRPWTALRMTSLVELQHAAFRSFVDAMDRVVVLCQWTRDMLVRNNIQREKIVFSRHGMTLAPVGERALETHGGVLRVVFLGRLHPTKGLDILLSAVTSLSGAPLTLDVFGISAEEDAYARSLKALAAADDRIHFQRPVAAQDVVRLLAGYDVLAVPSRWLETGPLVILEAFAAGIPVVGSRLGGIAELVRDGVDGLLVEPDSPASLSRALLKLARDRQLVARLRANVRPPRRIEAVADDMDSLYAELLSR